MACILLLPLPRQTSPPQHLLFPCCFEPAAAPLTHALVPSFLCNALFDERGSAARALCSGILSRSMQERAPRASFGFLGFMRLAAVSCGMTALVLPSLAQAARSKITPNLSKVAKGYRAGIQRTNTSKTNRGWLNSSDVVVAKMRVVEEVVR